MSIRLRVVDGVGLVALCAARSIEQPGDVYLDDTAHMALARKFWLDYPDLGIPVDQGVIDATDREESNNANRDAWDRTYGSAPLSEAELQAGWAVVEVHGPAGTL